MHVVATRKLNHSVIHGKSCGACHREVPCLLWPTKAITPEPKAAHRLFMYSYIYMPQYKHVAYVSCVLALQAEEIQLDYKIWEDSRASSAERQLSAAQCITNYSGLLCLGAGRNMDRLIRV